VGYFDRAPDVAGLNYWVGRFDSGMTYAQIAQSFSVQTEATNMYPYLNNPYVATVSTFLTSVYKNLFNRAPDSAGLNYWTNEINSGRSNVGNAIMNIISGAVDTPASGSNAATLDLTTLNNLTSVGLNWANTMATIPGAVYNSAAAASAASVIMGVTSSASTVTTANAATAAFFAGNGPLSLTAVPLTTGADAPVIGSNAAITGTGATFNANDSLIGSGTNNSLTITDTTGASAAGVPNGVAVRGIQTVTVNATGAVGVGSSGVSAVAQVNTYSGFSPGGATNTLVVNYGSLSSTIITGSTATTEGDAFAAAINNMAGRVIAVNAAGTVTVTAPTAGTALPAISFGAATIAADIPSTAFTTANVVGTATSAVVYDVSGYTGLTSFTATSVGGANIKAAATTAVSETDTALGANALTVTGGSSVTVTATSTMTAATGGAITVGGSGSSAPAGAVIVNQTTAETGAGTGGAVTITGGTSITANLTLSQATTNTSTTAGLVTITGSTSTTSVTVSETARVTAAAAVSAGNNNTVNASSATAGIIDGRVVIADANAGSSTVANTITSVTLSNLAGASTISSTALNTLTLSGTISNTGSVAALAITEGGSAATVAANKTLTINTGTGAITTTGSTSVGALSDASNQFSTVNIVTSGNFYFVNGQSAANSTVAIQDTALRTLNISGTGLAGFTSVAAQTGNAAQATVVPNLVYHANGINSAITAINLSGAASLMADLSGINGLTTLNTTATTGSVFATLNGTITAFTGGTGRNVIELTANDATKVINLGTNTANQLVLSSTGSTYQGTGLVTTTNVTGYTQLGVSDSTINTTYAFDVSKFAAGINTLEVYGATTGSTNNFTGVASGTALVIDNATTQVSYTLASSASGPGSTVGVTFNGAAAASGTGTAGYTTGTLVLQDVNTFGVGTVNMSLDASVGSGMYTITTFTDPNLANLNLTGTGALTITNQLALNTIGTLTINDSTTSAAGSVITGGIAGNNVSTLAFTGSHAINVGALTDSIPTLTISNVNTGSTGVVTVTGHTTSTLTSLTLSGSVAYTGVDSSNAAVVVAAGTDNQAITLTLSGTGAHTATFGNGAVTYVGGAGVDTLTFGTGANTVTTAGGADVITFGAHTGVDTVNQTGTAARETITGYQKLTSDVVVLSIATLGGAGVDITPGGTALTASTNLTFQQAAGGAAITMANTTQILDITGTVFGTTAANSAASLLSAVLATGSTPITFATSVAATKSVLVEYNGFDGVHVAQITQGTGGGTTVLATATITDLIDLVGVGTTAAAHIGSGLLNLAA
jgi:S-layer protein